MLVPKNSISSREVYLEFVSNLTTTEFIKIYKRMTGRQERLKTIHSDNAKSFQVGANWLKEVKENFHQYLNQAQVNCKFNLS